MRKIAADLSYYPNLEFFCAILDFDVLAFNPEQEFRRKSFINRTDILGPNKVQRLTVPIQGRRPRISESKLLIDYEQKWLVGHLRSIQSAYGKAPFFEHYFPFFEQVYAKEHKLLWDLNLDILTLCLRFLDIPAKIDLAQDSLGISAEKDIRGHMSTNETFIVRDYYHPIPYFQLFGADFEPNLSILDLLFNVGPESKMILSDSIKKH